MNHFPKLIKVASSGTSALEVWFDDGVSGNVSLAHLIGKGVFSALNDPEVFNSVYIDSETNTVSWGNEIELDPYALYLQIRGISFEDWRNKKAHASA